MGKVMKKIGGLVSKISKIVSPILSIAKMIPGIGQIASAVDAGMKIIGNIGKIMEKGFPKGLLEVAKMAVTSFLPGPLGKIAEFASGKLNIKRAEFAGDPRPLDETCECYCCANFSRAYLRHLYMAGEILSSQLNTLHNLYFYHRLMDKCREAIRAGDADVWKQLDGIGNGRES